MTAMPGLSGEQRPGCSPPFGECLENFDFVLRQRIDLLIQRREEREVSIEHFRSFPFMVKDRDSGSAVEKFPGKAHSLNGPFQAGAF
jgi:hypothetical protein